MTWILVIEDNAANMELEVFLLKNAGYEPLQARDAEEGIRHVMRFEDIADVTNERTLSLAGRTPQHNGVGPRRNDIVHELRCEVIVRWAIPSRNSKRLR